MPSRSIIRTGVGPHREPGNPFPAMAAAINVLAERAARVQSRRNLSRSLSPKLDHSHSITRFDRSRTGPYVRAFAALSQFQGNASLSTWLTRIVLNEALGRLRQQRRSVTLDVLDQAGHQGDSHVIMFPGVSIAPDPESAAARA